MTDAALPESTSAPISPMPPVPTEPPPGRRGLTPVSLLIVLAAAYLLVQVQFVLIVAALALLFATIVERPVQIIERRLIPRPIAILVVYVAIISSVVGLFFLVSPVISREAAVFRDEAPEQIQELRADWLQSSNPLLSGPGKDVLGKIIGFFDNPQAPEGGVSMDVVTNLVGGLAAGIVGFVSGLIIAFYYLMEKDLLRRLVVRQFRSDKGQRIDRIWGQVEAQVGRWMRGQLVLCVIIGTMATIGYAAIGLRFWPVLGLIAGITEAIPIIGPWLGGIPAVIIALTQGWETAALVIVFLVVMQTTENAVLVPRVMKGAVGLTPLTVFVAIMAGTEFIGIPGALLAIPFAAGVQVIIAEALKSRQESAGNEDLAMAWRRMREQFRQDVQQAPAVTPAAAPAPSPVRPEPDAAAPAAPVESGGN
jgi:predicted PurR-regulated permease PerM